ncbi:MAG: hypothetical protein JO249_07600, partial [Acidobacteria bacterium]|nr:hypothetical protein [Acidobacteriota bacterium]
FKDVAYKQLAHATLTLDAHVRQGKGPFPTATLVQAAAELRAIKTAIITYLFQPLTDAGFAWFSIN